MFTIIVIVVWFPTNVRKKSNSQNKTRISDWCKRHTWSVNSTGSTDPSFSRMHLKTITCLTISKPRQRYFIPYIALHRKVEGA